MRNSITILIITLCFTCQIFTHYVPKISNKPIEIRSYINQANEINIPFKKCFEI
jgi:hypothetical protein